MGYLCTLYILCVHVHGVLVHTTTVCSCGCDDTGGPLHVQGILVLGLHVPVRGVSEYGLLLLK